MAGCVKQRGAYSGEVGEWGSEGGGRPFMMGAPEGILKATEDSVRLKRKAGRGRECADNESGTQGLSCDKETSLEQVV
jgi:hypothetical protein